MRLLGIGVIGEERTKGGAAGGEALAALAAFLVLGATIFGLGAEPERVVEEGVGGEGAGGAAARLAEVAQVAAVATTLAGLASASGPPWRSWKGWSISSASWRSSREISARSS